MAGERKQARARLTPAQRAALLGDYDKTLGGDVIIAASRHSTLRALRSRGFCTDIRFPQWGGGPYTAVLTEAGGAERDRLREEARHGG